MATLRQALGLPSNVGVERAQALVTAQGLIAQNHDRQVSSNTQIMIDGTAYFMLVGLSAGDVVSNISVCVTTIGITPTLSKVGLYSRDGVLRASSAELGAVWTTATGTKTSAVSTPFTVPSDDAYYVGLVCKAATLPILARSANSNQFSAIGTGSIPVGTQTGQTDLPSPATIVVGTPFGYWVGIS